MTKREMINKLTVAHAIWVDQSTPMASINAWHMVHEVIEALEQAYASAKEDMKGLREAIELTQVEAKSQISYGMSEAYNAKWKGQVLAFQWCIDYIDGILGNPPEKISKTLKHEIERLD